MNQIATQQGGGIAAAQPRGRIKFDLMDPESFNHIQRVAGMYAASPLFPEHLRKGSAQAAMANAVLVLNIADRLNEDALTVAQNIYFVSGRAGWNASYMIAKANQFGVFKNPIDWKVTGKGDTLSVTAYATLTGTGKKVEMTVDMETAKKDGWTRNSKYQSMPERMLRYRSATALIRLYCPEVMIGMPVATEIEDENAAIRDVTPAEDFDQTPDERAAITSELGVEDAQVTKDEPKKEPAKKTVNRDRPKPAEAPVEEAEEVQEEEPEAKPEPEAEDGDLLDRAADDAGDISPAEIREAEGLVDGIQADIDAFEGDLGPIVQHYQDSGKLDRIKAASPKLYDKAMDLLGLKKETDPDP